MDGNVRVCVRDNSIGIPVDMLPKIFEMFAQLDNSLQRTQGSLGSMSISSSRPMSVRSKN